jgi:hypothetical protein
MVADECLVGNDLKGNGHGLIDVISFNSLEELRIAITGVPNKIRSYHLSSTSLEPDHCVSLLEAQLSGGFH